MQTNKLDLAGITWESFNKMRRRCREAHAIPDCETCDDVFLNYYGIKVHWSKEGFIAHVEMVDEQKFMLFTLKYS